MQTLERATEEVDPRVPILSTVTVEQHVSGSLWLFRLGAAFTAALGLLALGLSAAGLYGVMAYAVGQRRRELGIRAALGAEARHLMAIVFRQGIRLATIGVVIGLAAALGLGVALQSLLFGVQPGDPAILLGVAAALVAVSLLAAFFPALSASRTDPARTLRDVLYPAAAVRRQQPNLVRVSGSGRAPPTRTDPADSAWPWRLRPKT